MIGYMLGQELRNLLPEDIPCATLLTMVEVEPHDQAFRNPRKFVGPLYSAQEARRLAAARECLAKAPRKNADTSEFKEIDHPWI